MIGKYRVMVGTAADIDRATQLERIHSLFLERLRTPHISE
jgi:hypothetical protein